MTDLTGADIEMVLQVAQVMQRRDVQWCDDLVNVCQSIRNRDTGKHAAWVPWRPDQGGAAAWEVWVWLVAQCHGDAEIAGALVADQQHIADDYDPKHVPTYTCRAVVALGDLG